MRIILTAAVSATMFLFVAGGAAIAQDEEADEMRTVPVETWTCDFREGKGPANLDPVIDAWNKWMDDEGVDDYFAATILPQFYGELAFDIGWLGAWTDGHAMGKGTDQWVYESGDLPGQFFEVFDCGSHTSFVSMQVREQADTGAEPDDHFVLNFSNCSFTEDGGGFDGFMAAQGEWNAYADEHGFVNSSWIWWPIAGETDNDYDFKYLVGTPDHTTSGANWQLFSEGHWQKSEELFGDVIDCDISRVYDGTVRRRITAGE